MILLGAHWYQWSFHDKRIIEFRCATNDRRGRTVTSSLWAHLTRRLASTWDFKSPVRRTKRLARTTGPDFRHRHYAA